MLTTGTMRAGARELSVSQVGREAEVNLRNLENVLRGMKCHEDFKRKHTLSNRLIKITLATLQRMDWMGQGWRKSVKRLVCTCYKISSDKLTN